MPMSMPRILRIGGSFAIVLVTYWAYSLIAVPLIEPPAAPNRAEQLTGQQRRGALEQANHRVEALRPLFQAGDWELDNPKILESNQVKVLLQDYFNLGDGRVKLPRCTLVYTPVQPASDPAERLRRSVILQAPQGALLEFDEELDLRRGKIGRLINGRLIGRITIRSDGRQAGPDDDLLVVARDVDISENRIRTTEAVEFRWGSNHGRGSQLQIDFLHEESPHPANLRGPKITGIKSLEIRRLERLHLEFPERKEDAGKAAAESVAATADARPPAARPVLLPGSSADANLPVEVTCRGPFRFDLIDRVATFRDQVDVIRLHPTGPSDQINCEVLKIFFARRRSALEQPAEPPPAVSAGEPSTLDLQPRRIEALGNPVVVRAPAEQFEAWGERLEYDAWTGRILLESAQQVRLQQAANEIHAPQVQYQPNPEGSLGYMIAEGPGWLRGHMDRGRARQVTAHWTEKLQVRPQEDQHVVSLTGGADLAFAEIGSLAGKEIHFWLSEVAGGPAGRAELRPDRMLAQGKVRLDSTQLSGDVEQLEVWFEQPGAAPAAAANRPAVHPGWLARVESQLERARLAMALARHFPTSQMVRRPVAAEGSASPADSGGQLPVPLPPTAESSPPQSPPPSNHFQIVGSRLRGRVVVQGTQSQVSELIVDGNVRLTETQTARPDEQPVVISGDQIQVFDAAQPHAAVTVTGVPAHFEGRGLGLTGSNINLNRGTNRLWMEGPGQMDLPSMDRDLQGRPTANAGPMTVQWAQRMSFDGKTAHFEEAVVARTGTQQLHTETMDVLFKRPIRFADPRTQPEPEPEQLICRGGVMMENRTIDPQGMVSYERMRISDLNLQVVSGDLTANGPGWMTSIRRGSINLMPVDGLAAGGPGSPAETGKDELNYLSVRFQHRITGNMHQQSVTFHQQVRATFGPVKSWDETLDEDNPDKLLRGGILRCNQLTVTQMPQPGRDQRHVELQAVGNVDVAGATFTARAARMTYDQAKDQLILEGDGWTDAALYRQEIPGGPMSHHAARKIFYWPSTRRFAIDGARALELNQLPKMNRGQ